VIERDGSEPERSGGDQEHGADVDVSLHVAPSIF
jgi:hypothetical protein